MLTDGVWAEVKVGNEHLRLFSEHNAQGVQASVYNVTTKSWIAPSEPVEDIEQGKERAAERAQGVPEACRTFRTAAVDVEGVPVAVELMVVGGRRVGSVLRKGRGHYPADSSLELMNDLLYYEPLADLFEGDATFRDSSTQVKFGYLTLAASFHWNLLKLLGDVSPTYHLAPPAPDDGSTLAQLPYLDGALRLHVKGDGVPSDDWLAARDCGTAGRNPLGLHGFSAARRVCGCRFDSAQQCRAHGRHPRDPECASPGSSQNGRSRRAGGGLIDPLSAESSPLRGPYPGTCRLLRPLPAAGAAEEETVVRFGRQFLGSKKSAVLLKGGALLLRCLGNGRVVEVVDLDFEPPGPPSGRALGPLDQIATLNYSYDHAAVTAILTRQGEVLVAMGARICFSWDAASWRLYPAQRSCRSITRPVDEGLHRERERYYPRHLAQHMTTMALTLREDRLGALLVVSSSEEMIERLIRKQAGERLAGRGCSTRACLWAANCAISLRNWRAMLRRSTAPSSSIKTESLEELAVSSRRDEGERPPRAREPALPYSGRRMASL